MSTCLYNNKVGGGRGRGQCIAYSKGDGWGRGNCLVLLTVAWANAKQNAIHIHLDEPCVALKLFVQQFENHWKGKFNINFKIHL